MAPSKKSTPNANAPLTKGQESAVKNLLTVQAQLSMSLSQTSAMFTLWIDVLLVLGLAITASSAWNIFQKYPQVIETLGQVELPIEARRLLAAKVVFFDFTGMSCNWHVLYMMRSRSGVLEVTEWFMTQMFVSALGSFAFATGARVLTGTPEVPFPLFYFVVAVLSIGFMRGTVQEMKKNVKKVADALQSVKSNASSKKQL